MNEQQVDMNTDRWLHALQDVMGYTCSKAEELRLLVEQFESKGISFPLAIPPPELDAVGPRSVRVALGRIKLAISVAFETGKLSPEDQNRAKRMHRLCNDIREELGQGARPQEFQSGAPRGVISVTEWLRQLEALFPSASGTVNYLGDRVNTLLAAGVEFPDMPTPTASNVSWLLHRIGGVASAVYEDHPGVVKTIHRTSIGLVQTLRRDGLLIDKRKAA